MQAGSPLPQAKPQNIAILQALFVLSALALASPWLLGFITIPYDAKAEFYPQLVFLSQCLHNGESPFWNPHIFAGSPHIADPQSLIFQPLFLLLAWLVDTPSFQLADGVVFLHLILGGGALIFFCRAQRWHDAACLMAGLTFAFGGSAAWRLQHNGEVASLSWFAIALCLLDWALRLKNQNFPKFFSGAVTGVFVSFMLLGRDQIALLCAYGLFGCALWRLIGKIKTRADIKPVAREGVLLLLGASLVVLALTSVPILMSYELSITSSRVIIDLDGAGKGSLHPASLLSFVIANLYGVTSPLSIFWGPPSPQWGETDLYLARNMTEGYLGLLPILAIMLFVVRAWRTEPVVRFLSVACAILLLFTLGKYTPIFPLFFKLPGVALYRRPADGLFVLCACLSLLGAGCLSAYLQAPILQRKSASVRRFFSGGLLLAPFVLGVSIAYAKNTLSLATPAIMASFIALLLYLALIPRLKRLEPARPKLALILLTALVACDLAFFNGPNESTALTPGHYVMMQPLETAPKDRSDTQTRQTLKTLLANQNTVQNPTQNHWRVELAGLGFDWPNVGMIDGFDHDLGYNPIHLKDYSDAIGAEDHIPTPQDRQWSKLFPSYDSVLARLVGLRLIVSPIPLESLDKGVDLAKFPLLAKTSTAYFYENPAALPRAFFVTKAQQGDFKTLIATGKWPQGFDPEKAVLLERVENANIVSATQDLATSQNPTLTLTQYHNTLIEIDVTSAQNGYVVLNDVWHPWWQAFVDGKRVTCLKANGVFRAVSVPAGSHHVAFVFAPFQGLLQTLMESL